MLRADVSFALLFSVVDNNTSLLNSKIIFDQKRHLFIYLVTNALAWAQTTALQKHTFVVCSWTIVSQNMLIKHKHIVHSNLLLGHINWKYYSRFFMRQNHKIMLLEQLHVVLEQICSWSIIYSINLIRSRQTVHCRTKLMIKSEGGGFEARKWRKLADIVHVRCQVI